MSNTDEIPNDWHQKLTEVLSSEGVTRIPPPSGGQWARAIVRFLAEIILGAVIVVFIFAAVGAGVDSVHKGLGMPVGTAAFFVGVWFWSRRAQRMARKFSNLRMQRKGARMLHRQGRPPVLYLRSFAFDTFSNDVPALLKSLPFAVTQFGFEELLVQLVGRYAAVLAIGKPGEPAPPPGASRFYVRHDRWQQTVSALVPLSRLVIWATGTTEGLRWEIKHLIEKNGPRKLLLLVHVHALNLSAERQTLEWSKFLDVCGHEFIKPLPASVDRIRFIAFDDEWNPIPVPRPDALSVREVVMYRPGLYGLDPILREKLA